MTFDIGWKNAIALMHLLDDIIYSETPRMTQETAINIRIDLLTQMQEYINGNRATQNGGINHD